MKKFLMLAAVLALSACSVLGVPKAETFNQRLAVGYASVTTVRSTATTLLTEAKLTSADAASVQKSADAARDGLDVARQLHVTLPEAGEDKLQQATIVIETLQKYLTKKGK